MDYITLFKSSLQVDSTRIHGSFLLVESYGQFVLPQYIYSIFYTYLQVLEEFENTIVPDQSWIDLSHESWYTATRGTSGEKITPAARARRLYQTRVSRARHRR